MADLTQDDNQFKTNNPDDSNPSEEMKQNEQLPQDHDTPFPVPKPENNTDPHEYYDEVAG